MLGHGRGDGVGAVDLGADAYQTLLALLPEAYLLWDVATRRFVLANAAVEHLSGYGQAALQAMTPADLFEDVDGAPLQLDPDGVRPGAVARYAWRLRHRGGEVIPVRVTASALHLHGRLVVQLVIQDCSQREPAAAQAIDGTILWQTAQRELARRAAILRISRAFAESEPGSDRVMAVLLDEALTMLAADHGGISLWDASSRLLVQVYSSSGRANGQVVNLENSLSGRAALTRRPAISNDYQQEYGQVTPGGKLGARAGIAAPLLHENRLIGVISVGTRADGQQFGPDDAEALELLAGMAASMLGTLERAQLQAVALAARELAHRLNNDLSIAVGTIDILRSDPNLRGDLRDLVDDAAAGLERVGEHLTRLQRLARFQVRETPIGPALDLDRSFGTGADPS